MASSAEFSTLSGLPLHSLQFVIVTVLLDTAKKAEEVRVIYCQVPL